MDENWKTSFKAKLDQHYTWPSLYTFKFIVPKEKIEELKELFPLHVTTQKSSTQGNYISLTLELMMNSSDAVIDIYQKASSVKGLIAL
jgi:uncharacterized protein